jgi:ribosomal protein L12E/L44/L45/RPP1/RPP2
MALNFGILSQVPSFGQQFAAGQQAAQAQQERNMLRQAQVEQMAMQRENMLAQREDRAAVTQERQARQARAAQRQQFLTGAAEALAQGGQKLDRPTLTKVLQSGVQAEEPSLIQFARESLKALDEEELYQRESQRLSAAPGAAPTREEVLNMLRSPSPRVREQGKALLPTLPTPEKPMVVAPGASVFQPGSTTPIFTAPTKPETPRLQDRFVPVGKLMFDRQEQKYIPPPQAAIAATQERGTAAPAPAKEPAAKPLTAAQEATRRDKLGKEFKSASSALQTTQDVLDSIAAVKDSPGLSRATGFTGTMLPSFPEGQAAQAETRLANLKGKITALGKAQAAATGAIGSIANQEWKILSDQIAAIDPVKGAGPLLEQIGLVEAQALGAMERMRDEYSRQFNEDFERFPQFRDLPPPKSTQPKGRKSGGAVTPAGAAPAATKSGATVSNW